MVGRNTNNNTPSRTKKSVTLVFFGAAFLGAALQCDALTNHEFGRRVRAHRHVVDSDLFDAFDHDNTHHHRRHRVLDAKAGKSLKQEIPMKVTPDDTTTHQTYSPVSTAEQELAYVDNVPPPLPPPTAPPPTPAPAPKPASEDGGELIPPSTDIESIIAADDMIVNGVPAHVLVPTVSKPATKEELEEDVLFEEVHVEPLEIDYADIIV